MTKITSKFKWQFKPIGLAVLFVIQCILFANNTFANSSMQARPVSGTVTDQSTGEPLIGVTIIVKGTTNGTISDIDGKYSLQVNEGDVVVFSFIGYTSQEITVGAESEINIILSIDNVGLDEVVVVGYGVQKKKLNTGATLNMKGEDLQKLNTSDAMSSLQGISPGVSITSESGRPGAGTKVNIRGIGTIGDSQPLYVVDGIQVSNIDYLNPADIQSIDVLKDAASSAIYGSQAANGVILVTTRQGKTNSKGAVISYDMYFGIQKVAKDPDMLGAKDYMAAKDEGATNSGTSLTDWTSVYRYDDIMNGTYDGTDWFNTMVNDKAYIQSHSIGISDGNERSVYSLGASYIKDNGLLGKQAKPNYQRFTARLNSTHILKKWNGLDGLVLGQNLTYSNWENPNVATGDIYNNDVHNHLVATPVLPLYDENGAYTTNSSVTGSPLINPTASMLYQRSYNENNNNSIVGNAYLEIQPINNLKLKSSFGLTNNYGSSRNWVPVYYLGPNPGQNNENDDVQQMAYMDYKWIWTNTATYNFNIQEQHNFNVVLGQEAQYQERELEMDVTNQNSIFQSWDYAYLTNVQVADATLINMSGRDDFGWAMSSYFGRVSYDFREKYMFTGIIRRDGSTNFGPANRYATFPSVSAGWIVSQEDFMSNISFINYLKLRGSWGQNGNQRIGSFQYIAQIGYEGATYPFGPDPTNNTLGSQLINLPNPGVRWETSEQTNIGIDIHMLNSRLQTTFEWYNKSTKDWLLTAPVLATAGADAPYVNGGLVVNSGVEASLKWSDQIGDFKYSVTGTMGYNKNEVIEIDNEEGIIHGNGGQDGGALWQGFSECYRAQEGFPIGYFWGYESYGVAPNQEELDKYVAEIYANGEAASENYMPSKKFSRMKPGDIMFKDLNKDGKINEEDKTMIGNPNPKFIYGLQLSLDYKNFYFQAVGVGKSGHQVLMSYSSMGDNIKNDNFTQYYYDNAYHETRNPDGSLPRITSTALDADASDIFIYDADFFRISNLTLGYSFNDLVKTDLFSDLRIYVTGQNLFTFTKYPGMDPEVGWGNNQTWASGIDVGLYPFSKTYMVGLSVKF